MFLRKNLNIPLEKGQKFHFNHGLHSSITIANLKYLLHLILRIFPKLFHMNFLSIKLILVIAVVRFNCLNWWTDIYSVVKT